MIAAIVAVHAIFLLAPPLALTDIFNYINYGRMEVVHHLNPYTTIPILEPHSDPSYALSNWHQLLSPYGPLFTLLTFAVVPLGVAASFWALKGMLALASLATILLVWKCARLLGRDPRGGDRARRPEPDRAGVGARGRPQRLPDGLLHHARLLSAAARAARARRPAADAAARRRPRRRAATRRRATRPAARCADGCCRCRRSRSGPARRS